MRLEMSAADAEVFRQAVTRLRLQGGFGTGVSQGEIVAEMARRLLHDLDAAAPGDGQAPTAERFRVTIAHCPDCGASHVGDPQAPSRADAADCACADASASSPSRFRTRAGRPARRRARCSGYGPSGWSSLADATASPSACCSGPVDAASLRGNLPTRPER